MSRILVIHPALGTGGGSRWSLQAAESLAARGHRVDWVAGASPSPPDWEEMRSPLFHRHLVSLPWPITIAGRAQAALATVRALRVLQWAHRHLPAPDALLLDGVPFVLPQAQALFPRSRLVFYCHYPEARYAPPAPWYLRAHRRYWFRRERHGLNRAARVLVNGSYTLRHLLESYPELSTRVALCHPGVRPPSSRAAMAPAAPRHILCVGRFRPEKNLPLALAACARYRARLSGHERAPLPLVIAGGFDRAWPLLAALEVQRIRLGLTPEDCRFLRDPGDAALDALYRDALALVHPSPVEHFGMVAPEAMLRGVPVIGISGSGLADTVVPGETGFLPPADADAIAARLEQLHRDEPLRRRLGGNARRRVEDAFLLSHLAARLETALFPS